MVNLPEALLRPVEFLLLSELYPASEGLRDTCSYHALQNFPNWKVKSFCNSAIVISLFCKSDPGLNCCKLLGVNGDSRSYYASYLKMELTKFTKKAKYLKLFLFNLCITVYLHFTDYPIKLRLKCFTSHVIC